MITADWVFLSALGVILVLGLILGFGKCLKFFTSGAFGIVISLIVAYFLLGIVNSWQFVQDLLAKLNEAMGLRDEVTAAIDQVLLFAILIIIVQILRLLAVNIIASLFEVNNGAVKAINRILGVVALALATLVLCLLVFQLIYWVGGQTSEQLSSALSQSRFGLGWLYENNPLRSVPDFFSW